MLITLESQTQYANPGGLSIKHLSNRDFYTSNFSKLISLIHLAWRLKILIRKNSIETVQSHLIRSNIVNVLCKLLGSKHKAIITNHNIISHHRKMGLAGSVKILIIKLFYSFADQAIFISREMQSDFKETLNLKIDQQVIYNPHNLNDILSKTSENPDFEFNPDFKYIIYFGRLIKRKNVADLITVFAFLKKNYPEIRLIIMGDGDELPNLRSLVQSLDCSSDVSFILSTGNPFKYVARCRISVLPSNREGLPNTIIESMACHTVVIAADCSSGPREIISPDTDPLQKLDHGYEITEYGILYAVNDIDALKECIIKLLEDDQLVTKIKVKAYDRIQSFNVETIIAQHLSLLKLN